VVTLKLFNSDFLKKNLLIHPYDSNPDYFSKINPFYFSEDKKFIIAYYEGNIGSFDIVINEFNQFNYILEGELEITSKKKIFNLKTGDCFLIENSDRLKYRIKKNVRILLFIYPSTLSVLEFLKNLNKEKNIK
jgi:ethanolamine utilization protein EutQ (cupin superfamily)